MYRRPLNQVERSRPCYTLTPEYCHRQCKDELSSDNRKCCTSKPLICSGCHPDLIWCKITEESREDKHVEKYQRRSGGAFYPIIGRSTSSIMPPPLVFDRGPFWRRRNSIGETEKRNLGPIAFSPFRNRNTENENCRRSYQNVSSQQGGKKNKRNRTAFTPTQLLGLEKAFEKGQYLVGDERRNLSLYLHLSETQIKVWFQNRRTKWKRLKEHDRQMDDESNELHDAQMHVDDEYNDIDQKMSSPYIDVVTIHNT